jgi:hypothetical protein
VLAAVVAAWIALAVHPQPLFAYSAQRANVVLHAREPLPPQAGALLDDVVARVEPREVLAGLRGDESL